LSLLLNDEQAMLRDSVRDFLSEEAPVCHLRHLRDSNDPLGLSLILWKKFAHLGYSGVLVEETQGGLDLGNIEVAVILEEMGRVLVPSPFFASGVLAASALRLGGNQTQKSLYLSSITSGEKLFALALDESAKHAPLNISLRATGHLGGFVLDGSKTFVVDGNVADHLIVVARTSGESREADGLSLFIVKKATQGIHIVRSSMVDSHNAALVTFDGVMVDAGAVLGVPERGWTLLSQVLDIGRNAVAAELLGVALEVFERTVAYLKERMQFGRRIGEFQALQHRAARMFCEIELLRAAILKAALALNEGGEISQLFVSVAKAKAGSVAKLCVEEAIQMHGGMGLTDEMELGFFLKRARVLNELLGDDRFHADRVASLNGY
jgi:alkylation response protein AidB-like acyl-CoA dehydrogenase